MKKYLIIGASSTVGIAYLKSLEERSNEEVKVYAHYGFHGEELLELCDAFQHIHMQLVQADMSDSNQVESMLKTVTADGALDYILYLAADKLEYVKLKKLDWSKISHDMEVQVHGLETVGKVCLPDMAKKGYGKVVVMLSECTLGMPPKFMTGYVVVKYAMLGLMKAMAAEYGDKGINVNGISPGMMETKFLSNVDSRIVEMTAQNSVKGRNVKVEETVEAIHFLMSKGSDYINGENLNMTGGNK